MDYTKKIEDLLNNIKETFGLTKEDIANRMGYSRTYLSDVIKKGGNEKFYNALRNEFTKIMSENPTNLSIPKFSEGYVKQRRKKKIEADIDTDGILYVPIAAQAGYASRFHDPIYLNQLEKFYLPGFPYRGNRFRVFDVKGDSMEPTYKEGYHLVCELIDQEAWHQIANYYIYVVVLQSDIIVKRLFRKDERHFVAISDNEEFYPQFVIPIEDIKELWQVKRKIDWEMAPPKKFEIKV